MFRLIDGMIDWALHLAVRAFIDMQQQLLIIMSKT